MNVIILVIGIIILITGAVLGGYYGYKKFFAKVKDTSKLTLGLFIGGCIGAGLGLVITLIGAFAKKKTTTTTGAGYY